MSVAGNSMFASYRRSDVSTQLDNVRSKSQSRISSLLSSLTELEKRYQGFIVESKELQEHIWSIKIGFSFLMCFVEHSTKVEYVLRIQHLADELSQELRSLSNQDAESSVSLVQLDGAFCSFREKLSSDVINPETRRREVMDSGKKNSEICSDINNFLLRSLGDMTAINKANCIPDLLVEIGNLKQKLTLSQPLFHFLASGQFYPFMDYTLTPSAELLCRTVVILYSCLVEKMDREMLLSVKAELRDVLHKIDVKKIYFSGLLAYFKKPKAKYECVLLTNVIHFLESNKTLPQNHQCQDLEKVLKSLETGIHTLIQMAIPILFLCSENHKLEASYVRKY